MFFTYLWQSNGLTHQEAYDRFASVLLKQCKLYEKAFGLEPALKIKQLENILIAQIRYELGVIGWEPWIDTTDEGIAWGGICENYLGKKFDVGDLSDIIKILCHTPEKLLDWSGMFSVITWNEHEKKATLTTAATECPTLWYTNGPQGWASGPRAMPLLELVGNRATPNMGALGLYVLFGYLIGGNSPFENVYRIRDRQQITIKQSGDPIFSTYVSLHDYLGSGQTDSGWKEAVSSAAERIMQRVNNQLIHSHNPVVLLTGGRDSRSIATAARKTGHNFITATGGPIDSEDVIIAAQVAKILKVKHRLDGEVASPDLLCNSIERLKIWTQMTEGIMPLNYSLHLKDFLAAKLPFPGERVQFLHGVEPGIGRGSFYPNYPDVQVDQLASMSFEDAHSFFISNNKNRYLKLNGKVDDLLQDVCQRLDDALRETGGHMHHWFELLLWRERGLNWGMDLQSINTPVRWAWAPLFDRELVKLSWALTIRQKIDAQFLVDVSASMETALAEVPCTHYIGGRKADLIGRIRSRLVSGVRRFSNKLGIANRQGSQTEAKFESFWAEGLLNQREHIWKEFIDRRDLLKFIKITPQNQLLWRLLTVDLLAEVFFN